MTTLISNQFNKHLIVNLDNVTSIEKSNYTVKDNPKRDLKSYFNIHFTFSSICVDAELYSTWKFENEKDCNGTFDRIISSFDVVFL